MQNGTRVLTDDEPSPSAGDDDVSSSRALAPAWDNIVSASASASAISAASHTVTSAANFTASDAVTAAQPSLAGRLPRAQRHSTVVVDGNGNSNGSSNGLRSMIVTATSASSATTYSPGQAQGQGHGQSYPIHAPSSLSGHESNHQPVNRTTHDVSSSSSGSSSRTRVPPLKLPASTSDAAPVLSVPVPIAPLLPQAEHSPSASTAVGQAGVSDSEFVHGHRRQCYSL